MCSKREIYCTVTHKISKFYVLVSLVWTNKNYNTKLFARTQIGTCWSEDTDADAQVEAMWQVVLENPFAIF